MAENTKVNVEMENGESFIIELMPEYAPEAKAPGTAPW